MNTSILQKNKQKIKYTYHVCQRAKKEPADIFIALWDSAGECSDPNYILTYAPIGQHSEASIFYVNKCKQITQDEYKQISEGIYTPEEYIS